jgi:general secretion pathway protein F
MATYQYRALSKAGALVTGEADLPSLASLRQHVQAQGCLLLSADCAGFSGGLGFLGKDLFAGRGMGAKDFDLLMQQLAALMAAGLTVERALDVALAITANDRVKTALRGLLAAVRGGRGLADAMAGAGPPFDASLVAMVRAGEEGGALGVVLTRLSESLTRQRALAEQLRSALIYPVTLVVLSILSLAILITAVLPAFRPMFEMAGQDLPLAAGILLAVGDVVGAYWWMALVGVGAAVLIVAQLLRAAGSRARLHRLLLALPVAGAIAANVETARFSRTLATLLMNGVPLLKALGIARETIRNAAYAGVIEHAERELKQGRTFAEPLEAAPLVPPLLAHMVRVGEETGQLHDMLSKVADLFEREVKTSTDRLVAMLVPVVTIVMGIVIAGIITTILTTMLSVNDLAG